MHTTGKNIQVGIASPNPSYPQPIQVVTGTQNVTVRGKNEFNINVEKKGAFVNSDSIGQEVAYTNSSATYSYVNVAYVQSGKTYTLSWKQDTTPSSTNTRNGVIVDSNNIILEKVSTWTNGQTSKQFTPTYSGYLIAVVDKNATEFQLEEGSATTYEPYITPITKTLSLGTTELCKIGDYQDYIYKSSGKWYAHKAIGKHQFTGEETLHTSGSTNYTIEKSAYLSNLALPSGTTDCLINKYKVLGSGALSIGQARVGNTNLLINFDGVTTNETAFRTSLATTIIYAPLVTETDTEITDTLLINQLEDIYNMQSVNGTTIIECEGDLPIIVKVRSLKGE